MDSGQAPGAGKSSHQDDILGSFRWLWDVVLPLFPIDLSY